MIFKFLDSLLSLASSSLSGILPTLVSSRDYSMVSRENLLIRGIGMSTPSILVLLILLISEISCLLRVNEITRILLSIYGYFYYSTSLCTLSMISLVIGSIIQCFLQIYLSVLKDIKY